VYELRKQYAPSTGVCSTPSANIPTPHYRLTKAGYPAALIPHEYGGAGLGIVEGG
jgi:hypothetical protein